MKVKNSILKIAFSILVIFTISIINIQPGYCDDTSEVLNYGTPAHPIEQPTKKDEHTGSEGHFGSDNSNEQNEPDEPDKPTGVIETINPDDYKPTQTGGEEVKGIANKIIGILQQVGSIISVIALVVMGIKYMVGSVEEKATYKETMMPYFIGAILVFATTTVLAIISNIFA